MSVEFTRESENLFVISVKGVLTFNDQKEIEDRGRVEIDRCSKVRLLVLAEEFSGWGKQGDWGDLTFMYEHDPFIEKIAVVADDEWRDQILMFLGAGRRQASVRFFSPGREAAARDWLESTN